MLHATTSRLALLLLTLLLLAAPAAGQEGPTTVGIYVANQGNFSEGTGSVTLHDPTSAQTSQVAESDQLGTTIQSLTVNDGHVYVMSSTAGQIDVFDLSTNEQVAEIRDVVNPRYMAVVAEDKAYVTGQYYDFSNPDDSSVVQVVDLATNTVAKTIEVPRQPDHVVVVGDSAYVALGTFGATPRLAVFDTQADTLARFIDLDCASPRYMVVDGDEEIHVICSGASDWQTGAVTNPGAIVTVDAATGAVVNRIVAEGVMLGTSGTGQDAYYSPELDAAFVIAGQEIWQLDTEANVLSDTLTIPGEDVIGAVAYDDGTRKLYLGRRDPAEGFTTLGQVTAHLLDGTESTAFQAGIAPVHIEFLQRTTTATEPVAGPHQGFGLAAAYPNPLARHTALSFTLEQSGPVTLAVYDLLGRTVSVLEDRVLPAGEHTVRWQAGDVPAGIYLARLVAGERTATRRLVVAR